jgi:hypothetical protein
MLSLSCSNRSSIPMGNTASPNMHNEVHRFNLPIGWCRNEPYQSNVLAPQHRFTAHADQTTTDRSRWYQHDPYGFQAVEVDPKPFVDCAGLEDHLTSHSMTPTESQTLSYGDGPAQRSTSDRIEGHHGVLMYPGFSQPNHPKSAGWSLSTAPPKMVKEETQPSPVSEAAPGAASSLLRVTEVSEVICYDLHSCKHSIPRGGTVTPFPMLLRRFPTASVDEKCTVLHLVCAKAGIKCHFPEEPETAMKRYSILFFVQFEEDRQKLLRWNGRIACRKGQLLIAANEVAAARLQAMMPKPGDLIRKGRASRIQFLHFELPTKRWSLANLSDSALLRSSLTDRCEAQPVSEVGTQVEFPCQAPQVEGASDSFPIHGASNNPIETQQRLTTTEPLSLTDVLPQVPSPDFSGRPHEWRPP